MRLLPLLTLLGPLALPAASQDLTADLAQLRKERDETPAEVVHRIAGTGQREAAEALVQLFDEMASIWMRREILRALPKFDGQDAAEQVALDCLFSVAQVSEDPILREAALSGLADAPRLGRGYLARIVESPSSDSVRTRAMELHVLGSQASDRDWYRKQYEPAQRADESERKGPKRKPRKGEEPAEPQEIVHRLDSVRALAFAPIASTYEESDLLARLGSEGAPEVRSALLVELEKRRSSELPALARAAVGDLTLPADLRAEAASILARAEGADVLDLFLDLAKKQEVTPEVLRETMARELAAMGDEKVDKATAKLLGKGKPHQKRFALLCCRKTRDPKVLSKVAKGLKDKDPLVSRLTVEILGEAAFEDARKDLEKLLDKADDELLLAEVLRALVAIDGKGPDASQRLLAAASSERRALRNAALRALGKDKLGFEPLCAGLGHADWSTRLAAAHGLESLREPRVVKPLVEQLQLEVGRPRIELAEVLWRLTGQPFRTRAAAWKGWLADAGDEPTLIEPSALARLEQEEETRKLKEISKVAFFGIRVESHRAIFILDISGSMMESLRARYVGQKGEYRIDRAKQELRQVIENLEEGALFNVIAFNSAVMPWQESIAAASGATRADCDAWVDKLGALGGTNLFDSLRAAFEDPDVDTLVVLSDGEPSVGEMIEPSAIRAEVARWNRDRGIRIHTVAMGGRFKVLEWLAEDSGGTHVRHD